VQDSNYRTLGYVKDGRVQDSNYRTIGYSNNVSTTYTAVFFFFFPG